MNDIISPIIVKRKLQNNFYYHLTFQSYDYIEDKVQLRFMFVSTFDKNNQIIYTSHRAFFKINNEEQLPVFSADAKKTDSQMHFNVLVTSGPGLWDAFHMQSIWMLASLRFCNVLCLMFWSLFWLNPSFVPISVKSVHLIVLANLSKSWSEMSLNNLRRNDVHYTRIKAYLALSYRNRNPANRIFVMQLYRSLLRLAKRI